MSGPSRRQFLGLLGVALLAPASGLRRADDDADGYHGPMRMLADGWPLPAGWSATIDSLIESADGPPDAWRLGASARLTLPAAAGSLAAAPALLRSRGVRRACEFAVSTMKPGRADWHAVDVTAFDDPARCAAAWRAAFAAPPAEARVAPCDGPGESAVLSHGGWSLPGKTFFRRANVLASVTPFTPDHNARPIADALDRHLCQLLAGTRR